MTERCIAALAVGIAVEGDGYVILWCHNPEGLKEYREWMTHPAGAPRRAGFYRTVDQVLEEVLLDLPFYQRSGGGLTVSGGEPLLQWRWVAALLHKAKAASLHTCIETFGVCGEEALRAVAPIRIYFCSISRRLTLRSIKRLSALLCLR